MFFFRIAYGPFAFYDFLCIPAAVASGSLHSDMHPSTLEVSTTRYKLWNIIPLNLLLGHSWTRYGDDKNSQCLGIWSRFNCSVAAAIRWASPTKISVTCIFWERSCDAASSNSAWKIWKSTNPGLSNSTALPTFGSSSSQSFRCYHSSFLASEFLWCCPSDSLSCGA